MCVTSEAQYKQFSSACPAGSLVATLQERSGFSVSKMQIAPCCLGRSYLLRPPQSTVAHIARRKQTTESDSVSSWLIFQYLFLPWTTCTQSVFCNSIFILFFFTPGSSEQSRLCVYYYPLPYMLHVPPILFWFHQPNNIRSGVEIIQLLIMQSSPASSYLVRVRHKYPPQHPLLNTLRLRFSFNVSDRVSHPHKTKTTNKLCIF
jgi:hypothetical protein